MSDRPDNMLFSGRALLIVLLVSIPSVLLALWILGIGLDNGKAGLAALMSVLLLGVVGQWVRQKFRFGLRSLLLGTTAVAVLVALVAERALQARRERAAVLVVQQAGGAVGYDFGYESGGWFYTSSGLLLPDWLRRVLGDEMFGKVAGVDLWSNQCDDQQFAFICQQLDGLRAANVAQSSVTGKGLVHLKHCRQLERLEMDAKQLTAESVRALSELPRLQHLEVENPGTDRATMAELGRLSALRVFWVYRSDLADSDVQGIARMPQLQNLLIVSSNITDAAIPHLAPLQEQLDTLTLIQSQITDPGVEDLASLFSEDARLTHLALGGTGITDEAIDDLARFRSLRYLSLPGTSLSDAGIAELKKRLPKCRVSQ